MAVHVQFFDASGFKLSDYAYPDDKAGTDAYAEAAGRVKAGTSHESFTRVALVKDGKELRSQEREAKAKQGAKTAGNE